MRFLVVACLIAVLGATVVPPAKNFDISKFQGEWNIVGAFPAANYGYLHGFKNLPTFACGSAIVSQINITTITIQVSYHNLTDYSVHSDFYVLNAEQNNNAYLHSPNDNMTFVIGFFDEANGVVVFTAQDRSFSIVYARPETPTDTTQVNAYYQTVQPPIAANEVFPFDNRLCYDLDFTIPNFDVSQVSGSFFVNGHYQKEKDPSTCEYFTIAPIKEYPHFLNVTLVADKKVMLQDLYLPLPGKSGYWVPANGEKAIQFGYQNLNKKVFTNLFQSAQEGFIMSNVTKVGLLEYGIASEYFLQSGLDLRNIHAVHNSCSLPSEEEDEEEF